ncbi:rhamnose-binding lectin-like [Phyllopteryx taeniolatus]|uniref:rhamnose-binding lectin-like n=1 Tax=Phyllopteryx taeniolatus TaxID=161469 RepID=UPI002AD3E5B6|nr:rhamnose-binding lectin-like [Phyllopteryx taeniolatus]
MPSCFRLSAALLLTATCFTLTAVVDSRERMTTCDTDPFNTHRLTCDEGVISVDEALYGRSDSLVCSEGRPAQELANTQCAQEGTLSNISTRCNGKKSCEVNTATFRNPDPCSGILKYLETNFTCFPAITVVACEGSLAQLFCDVGQVIFIYGADYGRRDQSTCIFGRPQEQIQNTECLLPSDIVANTCNGKNNCTILATNGVFGDPCRGTYKYLEVAYTCELLIILTAVVYSRERATTCDSDPLNVHRLTCEEGVISVDEALYGRSDSMVCSEGRPAQELANTQCAQEGTLRSILARCNGKKSCEVNTATFRNPDPCSGILKYLETNFTCFPAITVVACEGSLAQLFCDVGQVIFIYGADYGRRDQSTCIFGRPQEQIENTECLLPSDIVANTCNGKNNCTIPATNGVFGDPCRGTYKYLEVAYTCEYPISQPSHVH